MSIDASQFPAAILEETIHPEHVIAVPQSDGTMHILCYSGQTNNGFVSLKYLILDPQHVHALASHVGPAVVPFEEPEEHVFQQSPPSQAEYRQTIIPFNPNVAAPQSQNPGVMSDEDIRRAAGMDDDGFDRDLITRW